MQINKHGTFYIRNGWPTKIIDTVSIHPHIFSPAFELKAVDEMGVGRVMVRAMRYWAEALGITVETKDSVGVLHKMSSLGCSIQSFDPYCQRVGTLWLLHRNLARDLDKATVWAWAFSIFGHKSFTKDEFCEAFTSFAATNGEFFKRSAVEKEFDCFKNTYVSDRKFDINRIIDEDTIPFFAPLNLISYLGKGRYEMRKISSKEIPWEIVYYCILEDNKEKLVTQTQINIDSLLDDRFQIGKYLNLSYSTLLEILQQLENLDKLILVNNFGNRYIQLSGLLEESTQNVLEHYYIESER